MNARVSRDQSWDASAQPTRSRGPFAAGLVLALGVLAAAIVVSLLHLREHVFEKITNRDGETLDALATQQFIDDKRNDDTIRSLDETGAQIQLAFEISQRLSNNIVGVRLFSTRGKFVIADPPRITEGSLPERDLALLQEGLPVSHFIPHARPDEYDLLAESNAAPVPLLLIDLPLHEEGTNHLAGVAQFLMNGESIAREYKDLDQHLALQGSIVFVICGAIISAGLALAFRRVQKANALLAERTTNLLRANRELALAAKTSAIGAVTSHLIHGLKNPLSGLRSFVQERASDNSETSDWELAVASTQRMQQLIDRVVRVLQEQNTASEYEVTLPEMLEMIEVKLKPLAEASGVHLDCSAAAKGSVSNREADLILLILENLVQNAIEATPKGRTVQLRVRNESNLLLFEVEDSGAGLSPEQVARLFTPCTSSKKGGSGIGLTISRQLAIHLGATLELKETSTQGTRFCLGLPLHQHREETLIHTNLKHR